ncbi:R-spondin-3-like [Brachionichthys hirsutus]|uniref:R-spondin-3-like n=1 Tax=Brachionichthys hirsutus TaxID=412623 RepID=UPI003604ECC1
MGLPFLIWVLLFANVAKGLQNTLRYRRSSSVSGLCPAGCATCSTQNGCLSCKPRLFFYLELHGIQQRGACLSSCPQDHYGTRSRHMSTCKRCKEDCASCFSANFCTRCHTGHFLYRGKCESNCPNGLTGNATLRECTECSAGCEECVRRNVCVRCRADFYLLHDQCNVTCPGEFVPDLQLRQCLPRVHCEVGEWTDWSPCVQRRNTQAHRRGEESRTRLVLQPPGIYGDPCPHVSEVRRCVRKKRQKIQSNS